MHVGKIAVVVEKDEIAGAFIGLAMGRDLRCPLAVEVRLPQGIKGEGIHQVGIAGDVPGGDQLARMHDDIRVRGVFQGHLRPIRPAWVQHAAPKGRAGGGLFVPVRRPAVLEMHAVQHAVAVIAVIFPQGPMLVVRAVAHIDAIQIGGHLANHRDLLEGHDPFLLDRGIVAFKVFVDRIDRFAFGRAVHFPNPLHPYAHLRGRGLR